MKNINNVSDTQFISEKYVHRYKELSPRESECLFFILRGKNAKYISKLLNLSVRTVEWYIANLKAKLAVNTTSQLILKSISEGYMEKVPESVTHLINTL